jgi:formate dehydrogenase iron-sulfur subunit
MDRRKFLKSLGIGMAGMTCGGILAPRRLRAQGLAEGKEFLSVLIDTTRCIGCRSCELACAETYGLPLPNIEDHSVFEKERRTTETQWTIVNRYKTDKGTVYAVKRCMHCNQPACVASCPVKAMQKRPVGPVTWDPNCMGCKMCVFSCPFDKAILEAHSPTPRIRKCFFCWDKRLVQGEIPACVEACPTEALIFGTRRDLLDEARTRIYQNPSRYVRHIYGENEVGYVSLRSALRAARLPYGPRNNRPSRIHHGLFVRRSYYLRLVARLFARCPPCNAEERGLTTTGK